MVSDPVIQKADPAARRKAMIMVLVAFVFGVSVIAAFDHFQVDIESWAVNNLDFLLEHTYLIFMVFLVLVLPVLGAGVYFLVFANRIARAQRFPPPGCAVSRDTVVLEGARAVWRARVIQLTSILLLCAAASTPVVMWYILQRIAGAA